MYKLAFIDLDGTMLNQYGVVTQKTKEAIKKVQEDGIEVIIASGRPIDSIKTIAKEIKSEKYFISGNGAIIYDISNDEIDEWQKDQAESLQKHPEIAQVLIEMQREHK